MYVISSGVSLCSVLSHVRLSATPWSMACQAPLSVGFSRQEHWSGLPFPSPGFLCRCPLLDLEKETVIHSSILAWRSPWTVQLQRVGHNWVTFTFTLSDWGNSLLFFICESFFLMNGYWICVCGCCNFHDGFYHFFINRIFILLIECIMSIGIFVLNWALHFWYESHFVKDYIPSYVFLIFCWEVLYLYSREILGHNL